MNKQLEPVFKTFLPALEDKGIWCWVYGGVAAAAYSNAFFRENSDVDIFVKAEDYDSAKTTLRKVCEASDKFKLKDKINIVRRGGYERPKFEIKIDRKEIMSIVPMYIKYNSANLVFGNGVYSFDINNLNRILRTLDGYEFYTLSDDFIKKIFLYCLPARVDGKNKDNTKKDAKVILSAEEFKKYYPL